MPVATHTIAATERVAAAAADRPVLTTIPDVQILAVGSWDAHTPDGRKATVTTEDIAAMVAAARDGHVRPAIVKLGHDSTLNDGAPALGRVENLRASDDGMTLIGDLVGVPTWLADIAASAYPRRSAEWVQGYTTDTGRQFDSVLTAISLLGEAYPAVETLEDIRALFASTAPTLLPVTTPEGGVTQARQEDRLPATIQARVEVDRIVRAFYDSSPDWSWVREVYVDPPELIIDDDEGGLFRLPYAIDGDTVSFGDRTPVRIDYIDTPAAKVAAAASSPRGRLLACFATKAATRQNNDQEGPAMTPINLDALRVRLGLPEDADTDAINAALAALPEDTADAPVEVAEVVAITPTDEATETDEAADAAVEPEPIAAAARVDEALERRLAAAERELADRRDRETIARRDTVIAAAVQDGRLSPADRDEYRELIDIDEDRITRILAARESRVPLAARGEIREDTVIAAESAPLSDSPLLNERQRESLKARGL
jgi:hypothetical protein